MSGRVVALAGGSGLVGGYALRALLASPAVERVVALVRRPLDVSDISVAQQKKLTQWTVEFRDARALGDALPKDLDDAHCALGTTMNKAGSRAAFRAVDHDAVLAFARAARKRGARRFILVSSIGADPRAVTFYARTKGQVEQAVISLGWDTVHVLQPSILDGPRAERRPLEQVSLRLARRLAPVLGNAAPIHAEVVGRAMVRLSLGDARGVHVHASRAIAAAGAA